jgi:hypothetical protein
MDANADPSIVPTTKMEVNSDRVPGCRYFDLVEDLVIPYLAMKSSDPKTPFKYPESYPMSAP